MTIPAPINRLPLGLLSFLDIKQMGKNPAALGDVLLPVLEMGEFFLGPHVSRRASTGVSVTGVGNFATDLVVPNGKVWIVRQAVLRSSAVLGAATTIRAAVELTGPDGSYVLNGDQDTATVGERLSAVMELGRPIIATAGQVYSVQCLSFAGLATTCLILASFLELDA